uniref:Uncharacterized protein n=1 Tax=Arundo donax TaxID=35708 RepID=A0A0A8Z104_ARUDO
MRSRRADRPRPPQAPALQAGGSSGSTCSAGAPTRRGARRPS